MSIDKIQKIAETFDPITLSEMDTVQLMNRVDTKFVFTLEKLVEILAQLKSSYFLLNVEGVLLSDYESLYFDGDDFKFYFDHHNKKVSRYKVRYRKYVHSNLSFLEIKHKNKGRTDKSRIRVDDIPSEMSDNDFDFVKTTGIEGEKLVPSLLNNFSRLTFVNKAMNERLTIDLNLTFKWKDKVEKVDDIVIAELKQGKAMRNSPFYQLMKKNGIRPLKISKYTVGVIMLYGQKNIKYNRFKKKLLKLQKLQNETS